MEEGAIPVWRRAYSARAIQITKENIEYVALLIGGSSSQAPGWDPRLYWFEESADIGDWCVLRTHTHELVKLHKFSEKYQTHEEKLSEDERYAHVFQLVSAAMRSQDAATYQGNTDGMDLIAMETTRKILREL